MKEGPIGSSLREGKRIFPENTRRYISIGSWELYLSKSEGCLMIDTTDYHHGLLYLTQEDLQKILKELGR